MFYSCGRLRTFLLGALCFFGTSVQAAQTITSAQASPDGIASNIPTLVTITAQLSADPTLIAGSVNLVSYDLQGGARGVVTILYDDGTHGDQKAGDNIFTTQLQLTQPTPTQLFFRVSAAYRARLARVLSDLITIDVVRVPPPVEIEEIKATNQLAANMFNSIANTGGLSTARAAIVMWLRQQSTVRDAGISPDGESIWVQYTNGLYGGMVGGPPGTWGGLPTSNRGLVASPVPDLAQPELDSVYNKWLNSGGAVFPDPIVEGATAVSIDFYKTLSRFGAISLAAHGMVTRNNDPSIEAYDAALVPTAYVDWARGLLYFNISYNPPWFVTPAFIKHYNGTFPGTIVFLSTCHSLDNTNLSQAFISKGAQAVFGWKNSVTATFAKKAKDALMIQMLDNHMTAGQAYANVAHVDTDPGGDNPPAVLMMDGSTDASLVTPITSPNPPPTAGFTMSFGQQIVTEGQTLSLTAAQGASGVVFNGTARSSAFNGSTIVSWIWKANNSIIGTTNAFSANFPIGTYTISLVVSDSAGLPSAPATGTVNVIGASPTGGLMNLPRQSHTATLLNSGLVLVTGGYISGSGTQTDTAEIFNPQTGTWRYTGLPLGPRTVMMQPRREHTATRLADGRVLIAGGANGAMRLNTAEIFDPMTEAFTPISPMRDARNTHVAVLLNDGRVLVAGGYQDVPGSAEIYTLPSGGPLPAAVPVGGGWTLSTSDFGSRPELAATLLTGSLNGKVLFAGGGPSTRVDLFDPASNTWQTLTTPMLRSRWTHTATTLPDGKVLIVGGNNGSGGNYNAELYDVSGNSGNGQTTLLPDILSIGGWKHSAALLSNGNVFIAGGHNFLTGSCDASTPNAQLYNFISGTFSAQLPMNKPRTYFSMTTLSPSGPILIAGGDDSECGTANILKDAELRFP
jgi:hypothetical protein